METLLHEAARHVALALQAVAIVVVAIGSARVLVDVVRVALASRVDDAEGRVVCGEQPQVGARQRGA